MRTKAAVLTPIGKLDPKLMRVFIWAGGSAGALGSKLWKMCFLRKSAETLVTVVDVRGVNISKDDILYLPSLWTRSTSDVAMKGWMLSSELAGCHSGASMV
jgi:hypothetical protein